MSEIASMVSSVGFPIAAFLLMFWFCREQLTEMRKTIEANTEVTNKLLVYMETKERSEIDGK